MGELSERRLRIALWSAFGTQAVGLGAGFGLADPSRLRPDYSGAFTVLAVLFVAEFGAVVVFAFALGRRAAGAAWWAAATATALPAAVVMLLEAGTGAWFACFAIALFVSFAAVFTSLRRTSRAATTGGRQAAARNRSGKAAAAVSAVALWAAVSVSAHSGMDNMDEADFAGTWADREHNLTLTLAVTDGPFPVQHYSLRLGTCTEEGEWGLHYPRMSLSVDVRLYRDKAMTCLPGEIDAMARVTGGTMTAPVLGLEGLNTTKWILTRQKPESASNGSPQGRHRAAVRVRSDLAPRRRPAGPQGPNVGPQVAGQASPSPCGSRILAIGSSVSSRFTRASTSRPSAWLKG